MAKIAILRKIYEGKELLFRPFSNTITKEKKREKWLEIANFAKSVGLMPTEKPWQYMRETIWANWRKRTLGKRDSAIKNGIGGKKVIKFSEIDILILDILRTENPTARKLGVSGFLENGEICKTENDPFHETVLNWSATDQSGPAFEDQSYEDTQAEDDLDGDDDLIEGKYNQICHRGAPTPRRNRWVPKGKRKLDLQIEWLKLKNYKMKLEILELEKKFHFQRSKYTLDLPPSPQGRNKTKYSNNI